MRNKIILQLIAMLFLITLTSIGKEHGRLKFTDTIFRTDAVFSKDTFTGKVEFTSTKFLSQTRFRYCRFDSPTFFSYCTFDTSCTFLSADFLSNAYLGAHYRGLTSFQQVRFRKESDFSLAKFDTNVSFKTTQFDAKADFSYSSFQGVTDFSNAAFSTKLSLTNLDVQEQTKLKFKYCKLPDTIDLSYNPNFKNTDGTIVDFSVCDFSEDIDTVHHSLWERIKWQCKWYLFPAKVVDNHSMKKIHWINLYNADVSKIKIDYIHFRLYFESEREELLSNEMGLPVGYMRIEDVSLSKDTRLSLYEQLLKNFKDRGLLESYKNLDIEYQRYKNSDMFFDIEEWWWGYGYEKKRIFIHAVLFFLIFSLLNFFKIHELNDEATSGYYLGFIPGDLYPKNEKLSVKMIFGRTWASLVYTFIIFFQPTLKIDNVRPRNVGATIWVLIIYSIGLFCLGYIANFIFQR